jgi:3-hydroxy-9,10-secoandrosta-1,3,5(10)-triene-9,17-dione monooxygenase reductase component
VIHDDHPFADAEVDRDPVRRFRGRLSSPVTIVTAGPPGARAGLTVSSLMVADGDPSRLWFICGLGNDLWDAIKESGAFVVHVLEEADRELSDRFAGVRPSPGGPFAGLAVEDGPHGPVLTDLETRVQCSLVGFEVHDSYALIEGEVEDVTLHDLSAPLQWFRGRYRP